MKSADRHAYAADLLRHAEAYALASTAPGLRRDAARFLAAEAVRLASEARINDALADREAEAEQPRLPHCTPHALSEHYPLCDRDGRYCSQASAHDGPCIPHGRVRMIPGQEPYTGPELTRLYGLVADAAAGDPGEAGEAELLRNDGRT